MTVAAPISSPLARVTPVTRPPVVLIRRYRVARSDLGAERPGRGGQRDVTPPMPPRGNPQAPAWPPESPR